jgi:hypothetical protein
VRLAALLILLAFLPQAQTGASRLILAAVTDARGRAVVDISADDFVVEESGATREILSARVADYPIVLLVDTGVAARSDFALMARAAQRFVERLGHDRPIAAGTFGDVPRMLTTFDDSREVLLQRLGELSAGGSDSQLMRGAALAATTVRETGSLFSCIVILSATPIDASREGIDQTLAPVVDTGAIVHVIANRAIGALAGRSDRTLRTLVEQTRGEYTPVYSAASFQAALDRLVERLGSEMLIEYLVPPGSKPVDAKIGIRLAGARVRGLGVAPK